MYYQNPLDIDSRSLPSTVSMKIYCTNLIIHNFNLCFKIGWWASLSYMQSFFWCCLEMINFYRQRHFLFLIKSIYLLFGIIRIILWKFLRNRALNALSNMTYYKFDPNLYSNNYLINIISDLSSAIWIFTKFYWYIIFV